MNVQRQLLRRLLSENPFQPATSWWRAVELAVVIRHGLPRGRGLDLGCGDGRLMRILLDAAGTAPQLVGADIDPLETREAKDSRIYDAVHTVAAERIPESDGAFDFVFSNSVLEHIEDIDPVIAEVARVLRPGGVFLFTVPSSEFHECLAGPLLPWHDRSSYLQEVDDRCAHRRYWGIADWNVCLQRHGISLYDAVSYLGPAEVQRWETLSRFTAGVLYAIARQRKQPIEIQRTLGLRSSRFRLPAWLTYPLAAIISAGVESDSPGPFGCLLVEGRKSR